MHEKNGADREADHRIPKIGDRRVKSRQAGKDQLRLALAVHDVSPLARCLPAQSRCRILGFPQTTANCGGWLRISPISARSTPGDAVQCPTLAGRARVRRGSFGGRRGTPARALRPAAESEIPPQACRPIVPTPAARDAAALAPRLALQRRQIRLAAEGHDRDLARARVRDDHLHRAVAFEQRNVTRLAAARRQIEGGPFVG
jgi:hypothetical protein